MSESRRFLIDTSAWIETLRPSGDPAIQAQVTDLTADDRAVLCDLVRVELWNGARSTRDHRLLTEIEEQLDTVPTTPEVWGLARDLARTTRRQGITIPASDLLIAACAKHHGLGVVHHDGHFDKLQDLRRRDS